MAPLEPAKPALEPLRFDDLAGFEDDDHLAAYATWLRSARALVEGRAATRPGVRAPDALGALARRALAHEISDRRAARDFFTTHFRPWRVRAAGEPGFVTGYYEPLLRGALGPSPQFSAPVFSRPDDLVTFAPGATPLGLDPALSGAQRQADGSLRPYPDRAEIEEQGLGVRRAIVWLEDSVELFLAQVQGSARVALPGGRVVRLAYDGRNGRPYTSIGRILIAEGAIGEAAMSLAALKGWLQANGLGPGGAGRALMRRNQSYVFFRIEEAFDPDDGPVGGAGVALTPMRSIAVDRGLWPYGTLFWIAAELPWRGRGPEPFGRLMVAQDTGSAILGAARADLFFGTGDEAGRRAGDIRHRADFTVLLPVEAAP